MVINTTKTGTNKFVPVASDINYYNLFVLNTPVLGNHQAAANTAPRESHPRQVLCRLLSLPVTVLSRSDCDGAGVSLVVLEECIFFYQSTYTFWVHLNFTITSIKSLCSRRSGFTDFIGHTL